LGPFIQNKYQIKQLSPVNGKETLEGTDGGGGGGARDKKEKEKVIKHICPVVTSINKKQGFVMTNNTVFQVRVQYIYFGLACSVLVALLATKCRTYL
jgi:hypothetical protein